jgi:hypothetical protein
MFEIVILFFNIVIRFSNDKFYGIQTIEIFRWCCRSITL